MSAAIGAPARALLRDHEISTAEWTRIQFGGDEWFGDACGCSDDRCIGYHHQANEACGCLPALLSNYYRDQAALADGRRVWTAHLRAIETGAPEDREAADRKASLWIEHYYRAAITWSLTETVEGRQGITVTNLFNDRTWLVWDEAAA
ncbi:hypothetical protein V1638_04310 [Pseudarthrobacter sp. J64]|uniref:hypothetical protein n=1 Tax=Pseudarthrobacter sp. J64 TaxID=3116485 RepID=UPI002E80E78B|nr:hypothetical protein [Pseudarthrobacter sp. J64]MEE2568619.1 hypothetical protein [Pseudarthrobacter sp. J64]